MKRTSDYAMTLLFVLIIFSVGVIQAIVELQPSGENVSGTGQMKSMPDTENKRQPHPDKKRIQFLEPWYDTFVEPVKKRKKLIQLAQKYDHLVTQMREKIPNAATHSGNESALWDESEEHADELMFCISDIRKEYVQVNRHRMRSKQDKTVGVLDSLRAASRSFFTAVQDRQTVETLNKGIERFTQANTWLQNKFRRLNSIEYPLLFLEQFVFFTVFNREYLRKFENKLEESSIFAQTLRPPMQFVRYVALHDCGEKAIAGKNGWMFYRPGVEYLIRPSIDDRRSVAVDPEDTPVKDNVIDTILSFKKQLAAKGVDLLVVIVPGKASIYPELLCDRLSAAHAGKIGHSPEFINQLRKRGVATVDLFTAFAAARNGDNNAGDSLYLSYDTHWKPRGMRLAAQLIARRVQEMPWYEKRTATTDFVLDSLWVERIGDVGEMTTLSQFKIRSLSLSFTSERTQCYQVFSVTRDSTGAISARYLFRDDFRKSRIVLLGDSFSRIYQTDQPRGAGLAAHLAYELSEPFCSIVSNGGASTLVRETLQRKNSILNGKKLVIWEFIERDLRYGEKGWKDIAIYEKVDEEDI